MATMCGRYSITTAPEAMRRLFGLSGPMPNFSPRYNVAPTQTVPVVRRSQEGAAEVATLRWGLIPSWAKDPAIGNRLINARAETVATAPAFRAAFRARRCLVPTDGFYEWRTDGRRKQPYRITMADGSLFAVAGLWEWWRDRASGEGIESFTIITTESNALLRPIHDRMPVILPPEAYETWLGDAPAEALQSLLRAFPGERMAAYPVSSRVNSPRNEEAQLILPLSETPAEES